MELDGHIVEFVDSGALRIGHVRKSEHRRLRIVDRRGRESSVPRSKVLVVHGRAPEDGFPKAADTMLEAAVERAAAIDVELLWNAVREGRPDTTLDELTAQYFGRSAPELQSAMFRALEADSLYFGRRGGGYHPRPEAQVASERARLEREREKEAFRNRVGDMLRTALAGDAPETEPEWNGVVDRLERWLRHREKDEVGSVFRRIAGTHQAREAAYELLARLGRIRENDDRFLLIGGFPTTFASPVLEAARVLEPVLDDARRADWTHRRTVAIDDVETVEIDDALTVIEDGPRTRLGIHIADVAAFSAKGDALDSAASARTATIYLPNVTVPMFPSRLSAGLASLVAGAPRPAFTIDVRFDSDHALEAFEISRSVIQVAETMTYEAADRAIALGERGLNRLLAIARRLQAARAASGAQTHRRPEIKVHAANGEIALRRVDADTPSRLVVSEMMILANRLAADHAARDRLPVIYRTQEPPDQAPPDTTGLPEALRFETLRKSFKRSRLSLSPAPHAGLGLRAYTQLSSPIRRYADLVTQRQFAAALSGEPHPYDTDALLGIITSAESAEVEIRKLEQTSTTYWILTYLSREKAGAPLTAMVIDGKGTLELTDYLVRGTASEARDRKPGDVVTAHIDSIRPTAGALRLRILG